MGLPFVGEERIGIVEDLLGDWAMCRDERVSRLVLLEGHPGVGKTRVVQEFYERLCAAQAEPSYWPELGDPEEDSLLQDRGRIRPLQFTCPPGAKPTYAWVAVTCRLDELTGQPTRALVDAVGASERLLERVIRPIGRTQRVLRHLWRLAMIAAGVIVTVLGLTGTGGPLVVGTGVVVAVAGVAFEAKDPLEGALREWHHHRHEHSKSDVMVDVATPLEDASLGAHARASGFLAALGRRGIPGVVVVDDAQWADADTVNLVDALLQRAMPALIIATVRPTPFEDQVRRREAMGRVARDYESKARRVRLEPLSEDDLAAAVRARAPRTRPEVALAIAAHAEGSPLVLAGTLDQSVLRRSLRDGGYRLESPDTELAAFARDPRGVFESYWGQLPEAVQQLVAVATLHGRLVQPDVLGIGYYAALHEEPGDPLSLAHDPFFWFAPVDEALDRFSDPMLFDVTQANAHAVVSSGELHVARDTMIREVLRRRHDDPNALDELGDEARRVLLRLHVVAVREGVAAADREAARSAVELAELTDGPAEAAASLEYAALALRWGADDPTLVDVARSVSATRLRELGRLAEAVELWSAQAADRAASLGSDHPRTLVSRASCAVAVRDAGRLEESIGLLEGVLADQRRVLGDDDRRTLETRSAHAAAVRDAGRLPEAIELFQALLADEARVLGPADPDTLETRNDLAMALRDAGRLREAIEISEALLAMRLATSGSDHPDTLRTRNSLATVLWLAGRLTEAIDEHHDVLAHRRRVLGPDHPDTLRTRSNVATVLWSQGRLDEAIEMSEALLADRLRVLGPDHPDTMRTRNNLAAMLAAGGRLDEAISRLEALLVDQERLLGPDHPDALRTRANLAEACADLGRYDEAIARYDALLVDQVRVVGPEHPDTLNARASLAEALQHTGRLDEAIATLCEVLDDECRLLGRDNPQTLRTQHSLAGALLDAGRRDEALDAYRAALEGRARVLGEEHPDTVQTREALAAALAAATG